MEAQVYEEMQQLENRHWWFLARRKIIASVLKRSTRGNSLKILDAGCGNGDNLSMLSTFGEVIAMEKEPVALKRAEERQICQVLSGQLPNNIPREVKANLDLVVLLDVLEHIDDDVNSLLNLHSLIANQGKILITVPAYSFLWSRHDELHHHKRRYNHKQLQKLLTENGFELEFISYFNTLLFPFALIDRLAKKVTASDDIMALPPNWLNHLLMMIFKLEASFVGKIYLPYGLSLMALARKT